MSRIVPDPGVFGRRLAELRKARGRTQEEAAQALGCSRPTYIAIEKGERPAKPDEIVQLAGFLGRAVHELVRPAEPVVDLEPHLRAVVEKLKPTDSAALTVAIDEFRRLAEDYRELERLMQAPLSTNYPPELKLGPRVEPAQLAEGAAAQERARLGLGDQPVMHLRSTLEWNVGARVFYGNLPSAVAGMYAHTAELGCCILINRKHPPERRRLSLAHEWGHLLVDRYKPGIDYVSVPGRKPANERFAEAFGLAFLMPASGLRQRFHDIVNTTGDFCVADLRRMSHFYFVSVEALALRLEQLALITRGSWQFLKESGFAPGKAAEILGLSPQPAEDRPFPERYRFLAVAAYEAGHLGETDMAEFLRCDVVTAREIVADTLASHDVAASGEARHVRLEFGRSLLGTT